MMNLPKSQGEICLETLQLRSFIRVRLQRKREQQQGRKSRTLAATPTITIIKTYTEMNNAKALYNTI